MLIVLAACSGPQSATPPPTPQVVTVAVTPAMRPLTVALRDCAAQHPEIGLVLDEMPAAALDGNAVDLAFRLGLPEDTKAYSAQIGWETIVVVVNADNPLSALIPDELTALFTGETSHWAGSGDPVQVWAYPEGDEIRLLFDSVVLAENRLTSFALLSPDPQAMLEAVAADPAAVGYLPQGWLSQAATPAPAGVKLIRLESKLAESLRQPVLSLSFREPEGAARALLVCIQDSWPQP